MSFFIRDKQTGEVEGPMSQDDYTRRMFEIAREPGIAHIEGFRSDLVCDFCSATPVLWKFQIAPGQEIGTTVAMGEGEVVTHTDVDADGAWGACEECKRLIMQRAQNGLLMRAVERLIAATPIVPRELVEFSVKTAHGHFWGLWDGSEPSREKTDEEVMGNG